MSRLTDAEIDSAITSAIRAPSVSDEDIDAEISRAAGWTPGQYAGPSALPTYQEPAPSILGAAGQLSGGIGGMAAEMAGRPKPAVVPLGGPPMPAAAQPAMDPSDASWGRRMAAGAIGGVLGAAGKVESSWRNIPAQIGSTLRGETSVWDTFTSGGANLPQPVQPGDTVSPSMIAGMAGAPALASPEVQAEMGQMAAGLDPVSRFVSSLPAFPIQFADPKALAVMIATHKPVAAGLESVPVRAMLGAVEQRFGPNVAAATQSVLSNVASNAAFGAGMGVASGEDREGVLREAALGAVTGLPFAVPGVSRAAREAIAARRMAAGESFRGTLRGIDKPGGAIRTPEPARAVTPESRPEFTNAPEKGRQEEGRPQGLLNEADEVAARVAKNHPGAVLELNDMSKTYDRPTWEVAAVEVKEKGKGQGSALMRDLIAEADKRGVRLVLEPTDELGGDVSRLPAFYERLGFTKSTDPKVSFSYVRDPAPPGPTEAPTSWKLTEAEKAKSEQIKAKVMRGEDLTPEEEAFSRLMNERFNARANATPDDAAAMSHEDWKKWSGGRDGTPEGAVVTAQVAIRRGDELAVESIKNKIADRLGVPSEEVAADPEALARFEANQQKWRGALEQIEKAQAEAAPPGPAEDTKPGAISPNQSANVVDADARQVSPASIDDLRLRPDPGEQTGAGVVRAPGDLKTTNGQPSHVATQADNRQDLSSMSYSDLIAEGKRLGVWNQGPKSKAALTARIEAARANATAPETPASGSAPAATTARTTPSTVPAESGPGADTPRPDVSSPDRTAREPWQMTRAEVYGDVGIPAELQEIDRQMEPVMDRILKAKGIDRSNVDAFQRSRVGKRGQDVRDTIEAARREAFYEVDPHARAVRQAVAEGRPVPPEVLADYPDLAPAPRPTPARAGWEASAIDYWRKKQAAGEQVPADILAKYPELGPSTNTPTPAPVEPKPAPEPKTAGPADLGTGAPDAAPKPKPQAKPSKPAAPFTKADLLKRMRAVYERNPLLHGDEIASDQANQAGGFSDGSGFFRFQGPTLPAEVRDYIDGRPWLRTKFRVNDPGGRGQDYLAELGDRYFDELDKLTGRSFEKMIDRLARFDQDPEGQFLAAVYRNLPAGRTPPKTVAAPDDIPTGATFTLNGERFRVVDSDGGYRVLRDGDKYEEVPIDALSQVPMDKGSLKTPKAQKSITPQPEQARDLLGNPIAEPATGRQRDMVFETETRPTDTSGRDATDAKIAEKFSEDDTIDLPFSGVRDLGSPPGAKWSPSNARRISPEPITGVRPKNLSEITLDLRRDLNAGIRAGKTGKWAGTYFPSSQDVLIKFTGDLDTTAHEIGHRIDDTFGIVKDWAGNKQRSPFDDELMPHFSQYGSTTKTGARSKLSYQRTEGVAEWIRAYVVNPDAAKKAAPKFAAHFEAKVPAEVRARLDDFGRSVREWYGANPVDQALANVRMELQPPGFLQRLAGKLRKPDTGLFQMGIRDRIRTALFDDLRPVWAAIEQARQLKGVDPAKISPLRDAMILGRTWAGVDRKILDILNHGPIDAKGNRVKGIGGVDWLLEPLRGPGATPDQIKSDYRALNAYMISERVMDRLGKMQTAGAELQQINADTVNLLQAWAKEPDPGIKAQIMEDIQKNRKRMNQIRKGPLLGYSGPAGSVDSYIAGKMSRFAGIGGAMRADWEVAREVMADVQKDPARLARIKDAAQRLRSWHDWLLTYARDKGRLTDAQYNAIKSADDAYVSFQRVASLEDDALADLYGTRAGGKSLASVKEISKRIKGGTREIENPYVSLLSNTHRVIKEADRNQVLLGIRRDLTQSRPMHAAKPPVDLSQFGRKVKAGDPDTTRIWVGGEAEYWQFAPQIHAALRKWGEQTPTPTLLMPLRIAASVLRNTVTHAPPFIVRNLIRDPINRAVLSRSGSTPLGQFYFLTPSGASSFNADLSTLRRYGGALFGNYQPSPEYNHRFVADKMAELAGDRSVILSTPAQVMRGVMALSEGSETIGRMAEFRRAFQKAKTALGYSDEEAALWAAYQARDLLDYSRAGKLIRPVSQYIPFLNAAMQGVAKTGARFAEAPAKTTAKWAAYVLLPSLATYTYNVMNGSEDEYRALPAWRRDFFFNFKIGPDSWLVLPKPFEMGVLASGVERAIDLARGNSDAMRGYAGSVAKGLLPVDESALVGPLRPLVEQVANHDFFRDQSIVPDWEADMDVALREGTKNASRIGQFVQDKIGLDARRVDHLSRAFFGNVGGMAQMASDIGRPDKPGAGRRFAEYTTGILRTGPGAQAVPFQAALDEFRRRGLTNRREYRQMTELARAYYDAPDRTTKDQIAAQIREIGRKVLAAVENLPIKPKTATASR